MASAVIGALRVNLSIDTAQFSESLKGVRASMQRVGKQMQGWGTKMSTYITAPLSLAGGAIAVAVSGMAKDMDELRKAAQISNVGFEEFQKLAFAARSVGVEGDKLADIFKDVNDRVGDFNATGGGPMKDFFEQIAPKVGLTADAFKNLSGPQALQLYYDSLVKAGASQQDMTFYLEAMASDATALIPLLAQGGEGFRKLGEGASVITEDQASGLKAYNDAMRALGEAVKGLTIAIATSGILEFVTQFVLGATSIVQALAQSNPELLKWGVVIAGVAAALGPVVAGLGLFLTAVAAISAPILAVVAGVTALTVAIVAFWPEIQAAWGWLTKLANVFVQLHSQLIGAVIQKMAEMKAEFAAYAEQLVTDFVAAFIDLHKRMFEIGGQIIEGLWNGIKAKWESVKGGIADIGTSISDSVKSALGIHSPSRVMHEVGVNIMQGLNNGMSSVDVKGGAASIASNIESTFSGIGASIGDAISGTKEWSDVLKDVLRQVVNLSFSKMGGSSGGFGGFFSGLLGGLLGFERGGTIFPGGAGGVDSQVVAFRKSPNERVDITKPGQRGGGSSYAPVYNIDARGADAGAVARIERALGERDRTEAKRVAGYEHTRTTRGTRG